MNIKRIGYFKEMPHGEPSDPSIKDFIGKEQSKTVIEKICSYLDSGIPVVACAGIAPDVIHPEKGSAGAPTSMTDGTWMWPGDLSYYVKNYGLGLSADFIESMEKNDWIIRLTPEELDYETLTIDGIPLFQEL